MARQLPSLVALRAFEATARHMSFTVAADELNVTQGAISRHIKSLEIYLGVSLFRRQPKAIELTHEGSMYYPALREALDLVEQATRRVFSQKQGQVLTLSVLPTLAMSWIIPRLESFNSLHPGIEIRMVTSIVPADFRAEIDMAIRVGSRQPYSRGKKGARIDLLMTKDWTGIEAEFLMPDVLVPVCSPAMAPSLGTPSDLRCHTLLHTATRPHAWEDWLNAVGMTGIDPSAGLSFGHFFMALQVASLGKGIACVPGVLVARDLVAGRLVSPFDQRVRSAGSYHMLYRAHEANLPKIMAFRRWLLEEARDFH